MVTYDLDQRGGLSLYDYLYRCLKEDILAGRLGPGEKLPSKRALARHLEVAVVTVENAYAQLVAEGYLYTQEKRGYFVSPLEARLEPPAPVEPEAGVREEQRVWLMDFRDGGGETEGFPFSVWARLMRRVLTDRGSDLLRATPHSGAAELREAIVGYLYHFRAISVLPEQVVVGAGTEYLYNLIVQLLGRERVYGVEDPGYPKAAKIYSLNGASCCPLPMDSQGISAQAVEQSPVQVLHISPSHQFPTGAVMPIARRQALLRWAQGAEGRFIVEDDYDSEFRFTGRPIPTLQSIDQFGRVIYMNTFSRTLAPSLRISFMVLPRPLLEVYQEKLGFYSCTVPAMEQLTLARFLSEGYFEAHVNRMRVQYRARRDRVLRVVSASPLARHCQVMGEEAGLHFLLQLKTKKSDQELARLAEEQDIRLLFLSEYRLKEGSGMEHVLVVNYLGADTARLEEALVRLEQLL